ncbi:hypothetical protein BFL34_00023 [Clavibacter michiganensis]|uniref:Uncharacterized protein n=1 Tax=Clavibacter michiganensis TaxID=28447 RepID=A0A251YEI6_9MICO|nr:hypothetical protein [Clavibacter michiganensis]OUE22498.1 hypothetical protein BFL34_00023 [Clavibacter michiganensis]
MNDHVMMRELRPDLRLAALSLVDAHEARLTIAGGPSRDEPDAYTGASYLALVRPDVQVTVDGASDTGRALDDVWSQVPGRGDDLLDLANLVLALDAFDRASREAGIFAGNVYLASEGSVEALARVAGIPPLGADVEALVTTLQYAELMYRFPVAFKFRGVHGMDRQCRLNGWGRLLASRLRDEPWASATAVGADRRLRSHLLEERDGYRAHLSACVVAVDDGKGREWTRAQALTIPVLT